MVRSQHLRRLLYAIVKGRESPPAVDIGYGQTVAGDPYKTADILELHTPGKPTTKINPPPPVHLNNSI